MYQWGCTGCKYRTHLKRHRSALNHAHMKGHLDPEGGHKRVLLYNREIVTTYQGRTISNPDVAKKYIARLKGEKPVPTKRKTGGPAKPKAAVDTEDVTGNKGNGSGSLSSKAIKGQIKTLLVDLDPRLTLLYDWVHSLVPDYEASFGDFIGDCVIGYCQDHAEQLHIEKLFQPAEAN